VRLRALDVGDERVLLRVAEADRTLVAQDQLGREHLLGDRIDRRQRFLRARRQRAGGEQRDGERRGAKTVADESHRGAPFSSGNSEVG